MADLLFQSATIRYGITVASTFVCQSLYGNNQMDDPKPNYIYFEGEISFPVYVSDVRKLIGKRIKYLRTHDIDRSGRGYIFPRYGTVEEVHGKNICIDGDWMGYSNFVVYKVVDKKGDQNE